MMWPEEVVDKKVASYSIETERILKSNDVCYTS